VRCKEANDMDKVAMDLQDIPGIARAKEHDVHKKDRSRLETAEFERVYAAVVKCARKADTAELQVACRCKYVDETVLENMLTERLKSDHDISASVSVSVHKADPFGDSTPLCCITSMACCCLPMLCWIPYYMSIHCWAESHMVCVKL